MDDDETPHVDASAEDRETPPISNKKWYILGAVFAVVIVVGGAMVTPNARIW